MAIERGYRQYSTGELIETDVINGMMLSQGVMFFADAAARDAVITSPVEGMHAYLADSKSVTEYNGTAWAFLTSAVYTANGDLAYFDGSKLVRIAAGEPSQVFTMVGGVPAWSTPISGAIVRDGGNRTEASTTSTTTVDILTVSGLSIAAEKPLYIVCSVRKVGANGDVVFYLKLNTTVLGFAAPPGTAAGSGIIVFEVGPGVVNYGYGMSRTAWTPNATPASNMMNTAARPAATITDVTIRGNLGSAADTLYVDELNVYSLAAS